MRKVECPACSKRLDPRGAATHIKACQRRHGNANQNGVFSVKFCPNCGLPVTTLRLVEQSSIVRDEPTPFDIKFCPSCGLNISSLQLVSE